VLLYSEVPLEELARGDRVAVEVDGASIPGYVVGTNLQHGTARSRSLSGCTPFPTHDTTQTHPNDSA
jgi:hypothetical protein